MFRKLTPRARNVLQITRNLVLAELLVRLVYLLIELSALRQPYRIPHDPGTLLEILDHINGNADHPLRKIPINPYANIFNRPARAYEQRADYWGIRPHPDTEADLEVIVKTCRGSYERNEKMFDGADCLTFLADHEESYYHLPEPEFRASAGSPRVSEYSNADGHDNALETYPTFEPPSLRSLGACPGPIVPYHTYWKGKATWRVEAFIKSYLFTQNLACSRLWLWLDADVDPDAVENMMKDPLFIRFLPLVERGDILVKGWQFPTQVPIHDLHSQTSSMKKYSRDDLDQSYVNISPRHMPFEPAAVSDAVRFINLHVYGGAYLDMDMLLLRDLRPLLISKSHSWAERWGSEEYPGDYNTAAMSLTAYSDLSTFFLLGAIRAGVHFHPRVLGRMIVEDGRYEEFPKLENSAFDAVWLLFEKKQGRCTVPCVETLGDVFKAQVSENEWEAYEGKKLKPLVPVSLAGLETKWIETEDNSAVSILASILASPEPVGSNYTRAALRHAGIVGDYKRDLDPYPPTNRTMQNFFKGSWAYHIHNQWSTNPEPSSWMDVLQQAHNDFFAGRSTNQYGERWEGPGVLAYDYSPEYI